MGEVRFEKPVSFGERSWEPGNIAEAEDGLEGKILKADPDVIGGMEKLEDPELEIGEPDLEIKESPARAKGFEGLEEPTAVTSDRTDLQAQSRQAMAVRSTSALSNGADYH